MSQEMTTDGINQSTEQPSGSRSQLGGLCSSESLQGPEQLLVVGIPSDHIGVCCGRVRCGATSYYTC